MEIQNHNKQAEFNTLLNIYICILKYIKILLFFFYFLFWLQWNLSWGIIWLSYYMLLTYFTHTFNLFFCLVL